MVGAAGMVDASSAVSRSGCGRWSGGGQVPAGLPRRASGGLPGPPTASRAAGSTTLGAAFGLALPLRDDDRQAHGRGPIPDYPAAPRPPDTRAT